MPKINEEIRAWLLRKRGEVYNDSVYQSTGKLSDLGQRELEIIESILSALEENHKLRELLWLRHGCPNYALYGDDGEMQCHACPQDFLRSSANDIEKRFFEMGLEKYKAALDGISEKDKNK